MGSRPVRVYRGYRYAQIIIKNFSDFIHRSNDDNISTLFGITLSERKICPQSHHILLLYVQQHV